MRVLEEGEAREQRKRNPEQDMRSRLGYCSDVAHPRADDDAVQIRVREIRIDEDGGVRSGQCEFIGGVGRNRGSGDRQGHEVVEGSRPRLRPDRARKTFEADATWRTRRAGANGQERRHESDRRRAVSQRGGGAAQG